MVPTAVSRPGLLRSLLSIVVAFFVVALLMALSGYNVPPALSTLFSGATGLLQGPTQGSQQVALGPFHLDLFLLAQTLTQFTPLLLCGLAVAIGLRAGLFNIGGQGQFIMGALLATIVGTSWPTLPPIVHVPLSLLAGVVGGALWGALAGILKSWRQVNEVVSTIMLNYVADNVANYLVTHNLKDPHTQAPQSSAVASTATLPLLVAHTNLSVGLFFALFTAPMLALLIQRTSIGYRIRAVGLSRRAARTAGISVEQVWVLTMALSGALAGLAGTIQVLGAQHRYYQNLAGTYGYDGIAVALLAGIDSLPVLLSALFFGALASGASYMQDQTNVPDSVGRIVQAIIVLFVGMRIFLSWWPHKAAKPYPQEETNMPTSPFTRGAKLP